MSDRTPKRSTSSSTRPVRASQLQRTSRASEGAATGGRVRSSRASHQEREAQYHRWLMIGLSLAAVMLLLILGAGGLYEYRIKPNQVLATVNGQEITRKEYWSYETVQLYNQARSYKQYATKVQGQQQTQFLTYAAQLDKAREDVWGSSDVSEATLSQMIDDQLYMAAAKDKGVDMSDGRVQDYAVNAFAPFDSPIVQPQPTPTMIPQRAEWATSTAEAQATTQAQQMAAMATPVTGGSPVASPGVSTPAASTPVASPMASPGATPAPNMANVRNNAQSEYDYFVNQVLPDAHMSKDDYLQTIVKPLIARDMIDAEIVNGVPQSAAQVEVQHILVTTEDLAKQTETRLKNGENFDEVAKATSTDTNTSPTGGKLGWVSRGEMTPELDTAAFSMKAGEVSAPIKSPYGWHILKVTNSSPDRALTDSQYSDSIAKAKKAWLKDQASARGVNSKYYKAEETPTAEAFVPPANAPTPIVATPVAAPDMSATPIAGPQLPSGTPSATPGATASPQP